MSIMEWLFQNGQIFPWSQEADQAMGEQSEHVQAELERFTTTLNETQAQQFQAYSEALDQLCDMEHQLCYENGFLFATMLWIEVLKRLGGLKM